MKREVYVGNCRTPVNGRSLTEHQLRKLAILDLIPFDSAVRILTEEEVTYGGFPYDRPTVVDGIGAVWLIHTIERDHMSMVTKARVTGKVIRIYNDAAEPQENGT